MKRTSLYLVLLVMIVSTSLFAQDSTVIADYQTWSGIAVKKSLFDKKLDLGLTQEFRFDDNSTHLDQYFTEIGADYEIFKGFQFGLGYRFIRNNKNSGYHNEQRIFADLQYKHKLDRLTLSYRFRFQNHDEIGLKRADGDELTQKYRLRVKAEYNIKKWKLDPYISAEGFFATEQYNIHYIDAIQEDFTCNGFEKIRATIGTSYTIKKFFEIGVYYRYEHGFKSYERHYNTATNTYIGGINLTFKL